MLPLVEKKGPTLTNVTIYRMPCKDLQYCSCKNDMKCFARFVQFKELEKHAWKNATFNKSNTPPWVFFKFFELYKWYQIAQLIT